MVPNTRAGKGAATAAVATGAAMTPPGQKATQDAANEVAKTSPETAASIPHVPVYAILFVVLLLLVAVVLVVNGD